MQLITARPGHYITVLRFTVSMRWFLSPCSASVAFGHYGCAGVLLPQCLVVDSVVSVIGWWADWDGWNYQHRFDAAAAHFAFLAFCSRAHFLPGAAAALPLHSLPPRLYPCACAWYSHAAAAPARRRGREERRRREEERGEVGWTYSLLS